MLEIEYKKEKLKRILDDLYQLTNINMAIVDMNFEYVYVSGNKPVFCDEIQKTKRGRELCHCSDFNMLKKCLEERKFFSHECHAGLIDSVIPVIKEDFLVGFVIIGRVKPNEEFDNIKKKISWFEDEENVMKNAYNSLTYLSKNQLESLADLVTHILFENAIEINNDDFKYKVSTFVNDNIDKKITVSSLCSHMLLSKNVLYKKFDENFSCTVNEYILSKRIELARKLIAETNEEIYTIAEKCGISNYTYFYRIFKKRTGLTPAQYKKLTR